MKHLFMLCLVLGACGGDDGISSDEQARRAYLGLDGSVSKSITLGFDGFNAASSANIDPQMTTGDAMPGGTLTITGQVDQGASNNKGMRLYVGMVGYDDGPFEINSDHDTLDVTYDTSTTQTEQPYLQMMLTNIPTGALTGSLMGDYHLSGGLDGDVTLDLTFTGTLMSGSNNTVVRVPGSTHVTGTATSGDGMYMVDLTI